MNEKDEKGRKSQITNSNDQNSKQENPLLSVSSRFFAAKKIKNQKIKKRSLKNERFKKRKRHQTN
jgi:hypothetical protein